MATGDSSLWKHRAFNLFWFGQTLSTTGDAFTAVAFPLLIYKTTGSIEKMTTITACLAAGSVATGLFAGPLVDRSNRRRLLFETDFLRALLMAAIPLASKLHVLSFPLLGVIAFLMGLLGNLFGLAYVAFVSELVSKSRVTEANSRLQASAAASFVVGPALAGFATGAWGAETAIGIDALSFLASFASLLFVAQPARLIAAAADQAKGRRLAGVRFILSTPLLRTLTLVIGAETLLTSAALDLFTFHLKSALAQSDARVGTMFAVASVGAIVGATAATTAKRRLGMRATFVASAALMALAFALVPVAGSFAVTAAVAVAFTLSSTVRGVLSMSRRQQVTPDNLLGRVTAAFWLSLACARVVGAAAVGALASRYGNLTACMVIAAGMLALAVSTIPARSLESGTDAPKS